MRGDEANARIEAAERERAADASDRGQRLDVALAEFSALRTELQGHSTAQGSLIALVVTAIGIVAGLVIKEGGDPRLLLILPALVSAAGIHYAEQSRAIRLIGSYIRDRLWPYLREQLSEAKSASRLPPSWEHLVDDVRHPGRVRDRYFASLVLSSTVPSVIIFLLGSVVPLVAVHFAHMPPTAAQEAAGEAGPRALDPDLSVLDVYRGVWWLGVALTAVYVGTAVSAMRSSGPQKATDDWPRLDQFPAYSGGGEGPRSSPPA
jgi:hypothetical protein